MTGGAASVGFTLSSSELSDGATFMDKHTCQAGGFDNDESPPLSWSGAPEGTMSYAITFIDRTLLDAGNHLGYHWAIWDLAASVNELPANLPAGMTLTTPVSAKQSRTSYLGPCPNFGGASAAETHTYEFTIYALPTATAGVNGMITAAMIDNLEATALERVTLTGQSSAFTQ
jgi:Raf kinase inhibitor-like YbhB/YbcL family protein